LVCLFCETVFTERLKFTALICSETVMSLYLSCVNWISGRLNCGNRI